MKVKVNLNDRIYVKLTDAGRAHVAAQLESLFSFVTDREQAKKWVRDGAVSYDKGYMQIHQFAAMFGPALAIAQRQRLFVDGMNVEIEPGVM